MQIPPEEIRHNPTSYVDPHGRLFHWQGRIYRGIRSESADFYRALLQGEGLPGMVGTRLTDLNLDGYGIVLEHDAIWPVSYCMEWPPEMLREAAVLTLELALALAPRNMVLQDAYPWNVLFDGPRPVFVDLGSIRPAEEGLLWPAYEQFCKFFLFPLYLYGAGLHPVVRRLLFDYLGGISYATCARLLPQGYKLLHPQTWMRLSLPLMASWALRAMHAEGRMSELARNPRAVPGGWIPARISFLKGLLRDVRSLRIPIARTEWSDYQEWSSFDDRSRWSVKQKNLADLMTRLSPSSVLDVACNLGWFSTLAARQGARVVAFDQDESCISKFYLRVKQEQLNIVPLRMDVLQLTPAFGWNLEQFPALPERIQGDLVLALALIHHLVITQWQSFERVAMALSSLTRRWLVLEYVPLTDEKARLLLSYQRERFEWYTLDNLIAALRGRFREVEVLESFPEGRQLLVASR